MFPLADRIGTKKSAIAQLEDADYEGHSLSMLQKIARVVNYCLEVKLIAIALFIYFPKIHLP